MTAGKPERLLPIEQATAAKRAMAEHAKTNTPFVIRLDNPAGALFLGINQQLLQQHHLNIFITTDEMGVNILQSDNEEVALEAFRLWRNNRDKKISHSFYKSSYLTLYEVLQTIVKVGRIDISLLPDRLILQSLVDEDSNFQPIVDELVIAGTLDDDQDRLILKTKLSQIWKNLNRSTQKQLEGISPRMVDETLFTS